MTRSEMTSGGVDSPRGPGRAGEPDGVLLGPRVSRLFRRDGSGRLSPGPAVITGGRLPSAGELGLDGTQPDWLVSGTGVPRVCLDGRSALNALAVKATAAAVVRAGAVLSGPLPSETAAVDLFVHELARQKPDLLVLTQPVAGDKVKVLLGALRRRAFGPDPLPILYNGPSGYSHAALQDAEGCSFRTVESVVTGGKVNVAPTEEAIGLLVREHLGRKLAAAGYRAASFAPAGEAAGRAAARLDTSVPSLIEEADGAGARGPGARGAGAGGAAIQDSAARRTGYGGATADGRPDVALVVAEADQATVYVSGRAGLEAASVDAVGTGSVDLFKPGRTRPGDAGAEGWLPAWDALARRLPYTLDPTELGNLTGTVLTRPWAEPDDLVEAILSGALIEELLRRLALRWADATVGKMAEPGRARLLVGTGHGFGRLRNSGHAAYCLINAFEPGGVTAVAVDPWGAVLAGGAAPAGGAALAEGTGERLPAGPPPLAAVCVSPLRADLDWRRATTDPWAIVTVEQEDGRSLARRLIPGALSVIPLEPGTRARLTVEPCRPRLDFGAGPGKAWRGRVAGSSAGIVLDGRGRPLSVPDEPTLRISKQRDAFAAFGVGGLSHDR